MERSAGSIPVDHIGIRALLTRTVEILHGPEAVADIEDVKTGPGMEYQEDGETRVAARIEITRGGCIIPEDVDTSRWEDGKQEILSMLCSGTLEAVVSHPGNGREYLVPVEYWKADISDLAFSSGVYDFSEDDDLKGRAVYFRAEDAGRFLDDLRDLAEGIDPAFFDETYWSLLQTVVWIYTRDRNLVCETSPRRETFGYTLETHTVPDGTQRTVRVTSYPDHFWAVVAGTHIAPRPLESMDDAENELLRQLTDGGLIMLGQFRGDGTHKDIPATDWLSLQFQWGDDGRPDWVGVNSHSKMQGGTYWTELRVKREAVLGLWPEDWRETPADEGTPTRSQKVNSERDAKKANKFRAVIKNAREKWPDTKKQRDFSQMAHWLVKNGKAEDFSVETVRKILAGQYPPAKKHRVSGYYGG